MATLSSKEPEYVECGRCQGTGEVTIRLGQPGTEPHTPYSQVKWQKPHTYSCMVCLGAGRRRVRKPYTADGAFYVSSSKADNMSFEEIFDAMGLEQREGTSDEQVSNQ